MQIFDESNVEKTFVERAPFLLPGDAPQPASPAAGKTRIGPNLVTDTIGSGGMATIYKVWNERLEVFRAIKLLSLDALGGRFETEVKITAKLRHPNIVEIYSVGEWNGLPYMEMEFIDGENLQQILNRYGRFPEAACTAAALCMADALAYAHGLPFTMGDASYSGIVHRDIKPANIMFSKHGNIKLTDFGIARPAQASLHTTEGNIVGTLHYLSPEQMEGREVDHRSDIYSLGAILYEMTTGTKTFPQESLTELLKRRAANSFRKLSDYGFPVNSALANLITRCLELDPRDRYPDAHSLIKELQKVHAALTGLTPQAVLANFYPVTAVNTPCTKVTPPYTRFIPTAPDDQGERETPRRRMGMPSAKTMFVAIPAIVLALLSIFYTGVRMTVPPKTAPAPTNMQTVVTEPPAAPVVETVPEAEVIQTPKTVNPVSNTVNSRASTKFDNITPVIPRPNAAAEPKAPSEDDLLRDAATAMNRRDWSRAISILERPGAYGDKINQRTLLLLESYVESRELSRAQALLDSAARTNDAHYFLLAGRYWFYRGNHAGALEYLESSLTRSSVTRSRNVIFDDAIYYIAVVRSERFRATPSEANRLSALDGWQRVQSAYRSRADNPRFDRAQKETAALN